MSQRGGAVLSHLRISDKEIFSELVPEGGAHLILSAEPMEALRYLPYLSPDGWIVTNSTPYVNIPNYPELETVLAEIRKQAHYLIFDAEAMAKEVGNPRAVNMVIAGAASVFIDVPFEKVEAGVRFIFGRKGEDVVNKNLDALHAGQTFARENR